MSSFKIYDKIVNSVYMDMDQKKDLHLIISDLHDLTSEYKNNLGEECIPKTLLGKESKYAIKTLYLRKINSLCKAYTGLYETP